MTQPWKANMHMVISSDPIGHTAQPCSLWEETALAVNVRR